VLGYPQLGAGLLLHDANDAAISVRSSHRGNIAAALTRELGE
jgi:hypothetical protein